MTDQHRKNGNEAIKNKDYIRAWEEYTKGLEITPKDPVLWSNRSFACLKAGFPELALMDARRVIILCDQDALSRDQSLETVYQKGKFRYAESLVALGLPRLAAEAFSVIISEDETKHFVGMNYLDRKKVLERRIELSEINLKQIHQMVEEGQKEHETFLITEEDVGFYQFNGKYPWDHRPDERIKESALRELQHKLDSVSNGKLKLDFIKFDSGDENPLTQLGVVSNVDIKVEDIIMEEDPFLTIHNHYYLRCDYCFHFLEEEPGDDEESRFRYPCPNSSCQESFCNYECYCLARNLYHDVLCGKDIERLIDYIQRERGDIKKNNLLLLLKLFAIGKKRSVCPLDVEEIKHLTRFNTTTNAFGGPVIDQTVHDTAAIFPLIALFNHNCDNNVEGRQYLQEWPKSNTITMPSIYKMLRKTLRSIGCNSYRMTIIAKNDIKKGEQLFLTYCNPDYNKKSRHKQLLRSYGFLCYCNRCEKEKTDEFKTLPIAWCLYFPGDLRGKNLLN
ncbi:7251_t:CDS:2 [Funneliformis geosporum]|uniref:Histone-lysine N-methyltransferase SET5 n=1 Tax=Funneliformis geosporum TaxID=1117311 RepID=A0A9W4WYF4_9GLOM|nr:7251_t:CDS:2 [Funneliformis geosporum]CAI2172924.1 2280_t:CDS:2 [Funneliformis geosporum]